jgi:Ca2+-binding EF-hand superfamily protein
MGIQPISGGVNFDPKEMFKKLDANSDGGIDKSEFLNGTKKKDGTANKNAEKIFAEIDSNSDGKIDETENTAAVKKMAQKGPPPSKPQGPPPGGASGTSTSSTSSSTNKYNKMDANKDGVVSTQEKLEYILKLLEESETTDSADSDYDQFGQPDTESSSVQNTFSLSV